MFSFTILWILLRHFALYYFPILAILFLCVALLFFSIFLSPVSQFDIIFIILYQSLSCIILYLLSSPPPRLISILAFTSLNPGQCYSAINYLRRERWLCAIVSSICASHSLANCSFWCFHIYHSYVLQQNPRRRRRRTGGHHSLICRSMRRMRKRKQRYMGVLKSGQSTEPGWETVICPWRGSSAW